MSFDVPKREYSNYLISATSTILPFYHMFLPLLIINGQGLRMVNLNSHFSNPFNNLEHTVGIALLNRDFIESQ